MQTLILKENDEDEIALSFDDYICQHLSVILRVLDQTTERSDPIRRITLASGIQVFFERVMINYERIYFSGTY